jgi:hypothetical protein
VKLINVHTPLLDCCANTEINYTSVFYFGRALLGIKQNDS